MRALNYAPVSGLKCNGPAAGAGLRPNLVMVRWCLALSALLLAGVAQAAVQYVQIPAGQDHTTITDVGGVPVLPFDLAPQAAIADLTADITTIPGVPASITGSLTVAPGVEKATMPGNWGSVWANGYTGPIFYVTSQTATLTLPPRTTAFYVFAQHGAYGVFFDITATTDSGATSGAVTVWGAVPPAASSIPGIGFFTTTPGEFIQTIAIDVSAGSGGFGIGLFGMAQAPAAPASSVVAVPMLGGWGLGLLGALVAGLGLVQRRRRV